MTIEACQVAIYIRLSRLIPGVRIDEIDVVLSTADRWFDITFRGATTLLVLPGDKLFMCDPDLAVEELYDQLTGKIA